MLPDHNIDGIHWQSRGTFDAQLLNYVQTNNNMYENTCVLIKLFFVI